MTTVASYRSEGLRWLRVSRSSSSIAQRRALKKARYWYTATARFVYLHYVGIKDRAGTKVNA